MASRTFIIHPHLTKTSDAYRDVSAKLEEAIGLSQAIHLDVIQADIINVPQPRPATLFGRGKTEELKERIAAHDIDLVVIDLALSPIQQRNLEKAWKCKVIDRTALILEIFGERAKTKEGKLQVELAALNYQKSRLVRSWTHLERQRGGLGFVGGPGESQIEIDRRLIRERIQSIKKQLDKVVRTRGLHRKVRQDAPYPLIALVGYTNAGKSTLFNRLTQADTYAEDALFATLDPTIRQLKLPSGMEIMLSDTVGFISNLPHDLVAAFRATLEEVCEADLIVHVRDIAHPDTAAQKIDVENILHDLLGDQSDVPTVEVHNKIDLLDDIGESFHSNDSAMRISAHTGENIDHLLDTLEKILSEQLLVTVDYTLDCGDGKAIAWLHAHGNVISSRQEDTNIALQVQLSPTNQARFRDKFDT